MDTQWRRTSNDQVVAVFHNQEDARRALQELREAGFTENQLGVVYHSEELRRHLPAEKASDETYAEEGAVTGALAGAGIGGLWAIGIAAGLLPAIGPAIAGGLLASLLTSSAVGAGAGTLVGALTGAGVSEEHAEYYEGELRQGRVLVTVNTPTDDLEDLAVAILKDNNAYNHQTVATSKL